MLKEAKIRKDEIQEVILVGGMTRMPKVQEAVRAYFGMEPAKTVHPDEVVALGAAVQAAALIQTGTGEQPDLLLLDVTPHNLGIMIAGGYFQTLIPANSTVPTSATHVFTTVRDGQTAVKIVVLQGDSDVASANELLGEFLLTGLPNAPRGTVEIDVKFDISPDGIVSVSAKDRATGLEQSIQVTATNKLTEDEMKKIIQENEKFAVAEKANENFQELRNDTDRMLRDIERLLPTVREVIGASDFGDDALKKAAQVMERAKRAVSMQDVEALKSGREQLDRTLVMFKGVAAKVGKS